MMTAIQYFQVDAFTDKVFKGNPAGVCPLNEGEALSEKDMQNIAFENNLSETAFLIPSEESNIDYTIRWFTPTDEVALCGHATLASAYVVFQELQPEKQSVIFDSQSGLLKVNRIHKHNQSSDNAPWMEMDFPIWPFEKKQGQNYDLGFDANDIYESEDLLCILPSHEDVHKFEPDFEKLASEAPRCVIISAPSDDTNVDFVSRVFCPAVGVPEDPVTGSAHCVLTPYWANRLQKRDLVARQISERGGTLKCRLDGERVFISGQAVLYKQGKIFVS